MIWSIATASNSNITLLGIKMTILFVFATSLSGYIKFWTKIIVYERLLNKEDEKPKRDFDIAYIIDYWRQNVSESDKLWVEGTIECCKDFWYIFNYYIGMAIMLFMSGYMSHETAKPFEQSGALHYWLVVAISSVVFMSVCVLLLRTYTYCYVKHRMKILYYGKGQKESKNLT